MSWLSLLVLVVAYPVEAVPEEAPGLVCVPALVHLVWVVVSEWVLSSVVVPVPELW